MIRPLRPVAPTVACSFCDGSGSVRARRVEESEFFVIDCPSCGGLGKRMGRVS